MNLLELPNITFSGSNPMNIYLNKKLMGAVNQVSELPLVLERMQWEMEELVKKHASREFLKNKTAPTEKVSKK